MQSIDSMESVSNYQWHFFPTEAELKKKFTTYIKTQKTLNSQSSLEKEE